MLDTVYLLYSNKLNKDLMAVFTNRADADIVCAAINKDDTLATDDKDFWRAYVVEMPLVGGWR